MSDLDKLSINLHGKIMNLQSPPASLIVGQVRSYVEGHKRARHDAAELVAEFTGKFQAAIEEARREERERIVKMVRETQQRARMHLDEAELFHYENGWLDMSITLSDAIRALPNQEDTTP